MESHRQYRNPRLEVVLDRSWETQCVTWSNLTWWDPLPCGQQLVAQVTTPNVPPPLPSPALSLRCHPPSPRHRLLPNRLSLPASHSRALSSSFSASPYSCSSLAWPLPPSPDSYNSYNSVFLSSDTSPDYPLPPTPSSPFNPPSFKGQPTPPDSEKHHFLAQRTLHQGPKNIFHFPKTSQPCLPPTFHTATTPP